MLIILFILFVGLPALVAIGAIMSVMQNINARHSATSERDALTRARRLDLEERRTQREALNAQKIAQDHNKTALTDIKIEREQAALELAKLKLIDQRQKMGLDAPDFTPENYTSDRTPAQDVTPVDFTPENY